MRVLSPDRESSRLLLMVTLVCLSDAFLGPEPFSPPGRFYHGSLQPGIKATARHGPHRVAEVSVPVPSRLLLCVHRLGANHQHHSALLASPLANQQAALPEAQLPAVLLHLQP